MPHFADDLIARTRDLGHPLCAGLDPHLPLIPPLFRQGDMAPADPRTTAAVGDFFAAALPRLTPYVAVAKPQSAFFELLGWRGIRLLQELIAQLQAAGVAVILDAKRGDIGSTASAYAGVLDGGALQADAMTVNPYLGRDTLEPFIAAAYARGRGVFVLTKTSNPGAADFQDRLIDGVPLHAQVAAALTEPCVALRGPESGWSSLGIVAGATHPAEHERLRAALPEALFLVPGYGAQGATARDAVHGFVRRDGRLEGGVVSSSRQLLFPEAAHTADARAWERAFDASVARAVDDLRAAVA